MAEPHEDEKPPSTSTEPRASGTTPGTAQEQPREHGHGKKKGKKGKKGRGAAEAEPAAPEGEGGETAAAGPRVVVPPKHHAQPAIGAELKGDVFLETAATSIDKLRDNWQVIAAALLFVVVVIAFVALKVENSKQRNRDSWEGLRKAEALAKPGADDFLKGVEAYRGTSAEPFFLLRAADAYFKEGGRENIGKAVDLYDRVAKDFAGNPVAAQLAKDGLEAAKAATSFDAVKYAATKGPAVEMAKDLPPLPQTPAPAP